MNEAEDMLKIVSDARKKIARMCPEDREVNLTLQIRQLSYAELQAKGRLDLCS
jgi:hypothetical protein